MAEAGKQSKRNTAIAIMALLTGGAVSQSATAEQFVTQTQPVADSQANENRKTAPPLVIRQSNGSGTLALGHTSHSSHASHASGVGGGGGGGGDPTPVNPPATPPADTPPAANGPSDTKIDPTATYKVTMNDERVLKGTVRDDGKNYIVKMKEGSLRVAKTDVKTIEKVDN